MPCSTFCPSSVSSSCLRAYSSPSRSHYRTHSPTVTNLRLVANESVIIVFLGIAATIPLIVGEFDLSVGYVLGLSQALVVGFLSKSGIGLEVAIPVVSPSAQRSGSSTPYSLCD